MCASHLRIELGIGLRSCDDRGEGEKRAGDYWPSFVDRSP